jgi:hypothetical protein
MAMGIRIEEASKKSKKTIDDSSENNSDNEMESN